MARLIFVTGGVVSSLGKGITAASLGAVLVARGLKVTMQKLDPYINVDPGTMSPLQHGEVFVTADGTETDLDLGHYERFVQTKMTRRNNLTTGRIYADVIGLRSVNTTDFMTAKATALPHEFVEHVSTRIVNEIDGISRVVYDITSKPPATTEWE